MLLSQHCVLFSMLSSVIRLLTVMQKNLCYVFDATFSGDTDAWGRASLVHRGLVLVSSHPTDDIFIWLFSPSRIEPIASTSAHCA